MILAFKARSLRKEEQESFGQDVPSLKGEIIITRRENAWLKWLFCAFSTGVGAAGIGAVVLLIPFLQRKVETHYVAIHDNGEIHEIDNAKDAANLFPDPAKQFWARRYIELTEEYVPETDDKHYQQVQLMSSPDQSARYKNWHDSDPLAPRQVLGKHGSVDTGDYHFTPVAVADNGHHLTEFHVSFKRTETYQGASKPPDLYEADIQFEFWPEMVMTPQQLQGNPGGMQTLFYKGGKTQ